MVFTLALLLAAAPAPLATVAEQSGFLRTGRYQEVEWLCAEFPKRYPGKVRCDSFGTTPEGRKMFALVASTDGTNTPELVKKKQRPVVLLQGGIHAGEIDGKDAGFWLLRDLLDGKVAPGSLSAITLVFVPVFNVDGHERFGANNRPNQIGPEEMGWRVTSSNLNLNRDYAKSDTPEMQAMLQLLLKWDPILYGDLHVTDGAKFQPDVSVLIEPQLVGPASMKAAGHALTSSLFDELKQQGHQPLDFYPSFVKDDEPLSGFAAGAPPPRLSHGYWPMRNRFGMLVETHSWKSYKERVKATYDVCLGIVTRAAQNGSAWLKIAKEADDADTKRAGQSLPLIWDATEHTTTIDFPGYAFTREDSTVSGQKWVRYDDARPEVWKVPLKDELKPAVVVKAPMGGYLVPPPHAAWVKERLALHGFTSRVLEQPIKAAALETFRAVETKFRPAPYEGRQLVALKGEWKNEQRDVPKGTLFVPIAQPHIILLMNLMEPAAPDSFASWGFFNAHFEQKEYLESYVAEDAARVMLKDVQVKAAFDARLEADPEFAKNPEARLRFFASRHPSWDERFNLLPIYRIDRAP